MKLFQIISSSSSPLNRNNQPLPNQTSLFGIFRMTASKTSTVLLLLCLLLAFSPSSLHVQGLPTRFQEDEPHFPSTNRHPMHNRLFKRDYGTSHEHFSGIRSFFHSIKEKTASFWSRVKSRFSSKSNNLQRRSFDEFAHNTRDKMSYAMNTVKNGVSSWWDRFKSGSKRFWRRLTNKKGSDGSNDDAGEGEDGNLKEDSVADLAKRDFFENVEKKADRIEQATVDTKVAVKEGVIWGKNKIGEGIRKTPEIAKKAWNTAKCTWDQVNCSLNLENESEKELEQQSRQKQTQPLAKGQEGEGEDDEDDEVEIEGIN